MRDRLAFIYLSFGGRIGRRDYWLWFLLPNVPLGLALGALDGTYFDTALLALVLWPTIAVQAKRWHDQDLSAWWILINLIPVAGWLLAIAINGFAPGTRGDNQYGPAPSVDSNRA